MDDTLQQFYHRGPFPGGTPINGQMFPGGIPGTSPGMGMALQMILQPFISQLFAGSGMMPGQFMPMQNFADFQNQRNFITQNQRARQVAGEADQEMYTRILQRTIPGIDEAGAKRGAGDIAQIGNIMGAINPQFWDRLHPFGSSSQLGGSVHQAGRYMVDPTTGLMGTMSGDVAGTMGRDIYNQLYGKESQGRTMHGIYAGEAGIMLEELQRRGFAGSASGPITSEQRQRLLDSPQTQEQNRAAQVTRTKQTLEKYSGAVNAMKELFGDAGHPNAPIPALMNALDAMTQGNLGNMSPAKLEQTIRTFKNLAGNSPTGIQNGMRIFGATTGMADQLGLDRSFGLQATMGSMAFADAVGNFGNLESGGWRRLNKEALQNLDAQFRMKAAASPDAMRVNAMMRMAAELGAGSDKFKGSELEKYFEAVKGGKTSYEMDLGGGKKEQRSILQTQEQLKRMAQAAGISEEAFADIMSRGVANQEYGSRFGTGDIIRRTQTQTIAKPLLTDVASGVLRRQFEKSGIGQKTMFKASEAVAGALVNMDKELLKDPIKRNQFIVDTIWNSLSPEEQKQIGDKKNLSEMGSRIWASGEERIQRGRYRDANSLSSFLDLFSPKTMEAAEGVYGQRKASAELQGVMGGFGGETPIRRLMQTVYNADEKTDMNQLMGRFFNGQPKEEVVKQLTPALKELARLEKEFDRLGPRDKDKRDALRKQIEQLVKGTGRGDGLAGMGLEAYIRRQGAKVAEDQASKSPEEAKKDEEAKQAQAQAEAPWWQRWLPGGRRADPAQAPGARDEQAAAGGAGGRQRVSEIVIIQGELKVSKDGILTFSNVRGRGTTPVEEGKA